jgi:hypothetical protein
MDVVSWSVSTYMIVTASPTQVYQHCVLICFHDVGSIAYQLGNIDIGSSVLNLLGATDVCVTTEPRIQDPRWCCERGPS